MGVHPDDNIHPQSRHLYTFLQTENKVPTLEEYIKNRDWVGAIAFLEHEKG